MTQLPRPSIAIAARVVFACVITASGGAGPALAQGGEIDRLWSSYDETSERHNEAVAACDDVDATTTSGDRVCRDAIAVGRDLIGVLERLLRADRDLATTDVELLIDHLLTVRQHVGSLLVEVDECDEALALLEELERDPDLAERRRLYNAVQTWLDRASLCATPEEEELLVTDQPSDEPPLIAEEPFEPGEEVIDPGVVVVVSPPEEAPTVNDGSGGAAAPWILAGLGVSALATGVGIMVGPFANADETIVCWNSDACYPGFDDPQGLQDALNRRSDLNRAASASLIGGSVLIAGGIVWGIVRGSRGGPGDDASGADVMISPNLALDRFLVNFNATF